MIGDLIPGWTALPWLEEQVARRLDPPPVNTVFSREGVLIRSTTVPHGMDVEYWIKQHGNPHCYWDYGLIRNGQLIVTQLFQVFQCAH